MNRQSYSLIESYFSFSSDKCLRKIKNFFLCLQDEAVHTESNCLDTNILSAALPAYAC